MNKELTALINLLDDPDHEVYQLVSSKITHYGPEIIPYLETYSEQNATLELQERIELLIHKMRFKELRNELTDWTNEHDNELLYGAYLIAKYSFPTIDYEIISNEIDKLRKSIWLELNNYLTPLEKINVINNIIFKFHRYNGVEINYQKKGQFFINNLLESKHGNSFSLVILYNVLCQWLDVPIYVLKFPKQLILCYLDPHIDYFNPDENNFLKIKFFIDPIFGNVISHNDVELFFKRISLSPSTKYFRPLSNEKIIQHTLVEYCKCFNDIENKQTLQEINEFITLLKI
jgi:hypothetical protein